MSSLAISRTLRGTIAVAVLASCAQSNADVQQATEAVGSIEGDVFLLMKNGDVKRGAGLTVALVLTSDSLDTRLRAICAVTDSTIGALTAAMRRQMDRSESWLNRSRMETEKGNPYQAAEASDSATSQLRAVEALDTRVAELVSAAPAKLLGAAIGAPVEEASTGMNAHYRFPRVPAGRYLLFANWDIMDKHYHWITPTTIAGADSARVDLDNAALDKHVCGSLRPMFEQR